MAHISAWTREHVRGIGEDIGAASAALISEAEVLPVALNFGIWDAWPVQAVNGSPFQQSEGCQLWMALGAPRFADPDERHRHARIHLIQRENGEWRHLGPAMPAGFSPGSREWSGSAVIGNDGETVTLYFTAAGRRGEERLSFEQRIFSAKATLDLASRDPRLIGWRDLQEIVQLDPAHYMATVGGTDEIGKIKAFRDPAFFRDPADGSDYLLFAGSAARSPSPYNGVVGVARADTISATGWHVLPPLLTADTLNNELERPHVVHIYGLYYMFWSTQRHVFDPEGPTGPTGLYGMVSDRLLGDWRPLNETGLVLANPSAAPSQSYSWLVLSDLSVTSFIDDWGTSGVRRFGGTFAPFLHLRLAGDSASVEY